MTLDDCLDYRRWAKGMLENNEVDKAKGLINHATYVERYYYLKSWITDFDRCLGNFTCWPEHHVNYIDGLKRLKQMCTSL